MKNLIYIMLLSISLSGCLITKWNDVSQEPKFAGLIGAEFVVNEPFRAHGVTMKPNYEKILDHYSITPLPGFSGPEVLSITILPKGTKFKIIRVQRCVDCLINEEVLELMITEGPKLDGAPCRLDYDAFAKNKNKEFTILTHNQAARPDR